LIAKVPSSQRDGSPAEVKSQSGKTNDQINPSLGNEARKRDNSPVATHISG